MPGPLNLLFPAAVIDPVLADRARTNNTLNAKTPRVRET